MGQARGKWREIDNSVPIHNKKYAVEERKIVWQKPNHEQPITTGISYNGLADAKKIDLASPREDAKLVYTAKDLEPNEEQELLKILQEYKYMFAWSYKDFKGVDPVVC